MSNSLFAFLPKWDQKQLKNKNGYHISYFLPNEFLYLIIRSMRNIDMREKNEGNLVLPGAFAACNAVEAKHPRWLPWGSKLADVLSWSDRAQIQV